MSVSFIQADAGVRGFEFGAGGLGFRVSGLGLGRHVKISSAVLIRGHMKKLAKSLDCLAWPNPHTISLLKYCSTCHSCPLALYPLPYLASPTSPYPESEVHRAVSKETASVRQSCHYDILFRVCG